QAAYRSDVKRLETAAKVFLSVESDKTDIEPVGFELSFGFGKTDGLNREDPVPIRLSKNIQFRLQGQIDRIDRTEDGYHIWDYKTGSMAPYDETDLLKRGTHLQWVLYAYALEHIFKQHHRPGPVLQSGYVFPSDREHGRDISETPPPPEALADVLTPLFELVVKGGFFHTQKEDRCTYCQFNRICASEKRLPKDMKDIQEHTTDVSLADLLDTLNRWMHV
ncbi:MAG: PD-(D/E)XK nuclease family protein, partial [bacterium]|nr:PD-(D/E)XK nuclease family protein [bacterium]